MAILEAKLAAEEAERIRIERIEEERIAAEVERIRLEVNEFLLTKPEGADAARLQTWRLLK